MPNTDFGCILIKNRCHNTETSNQFVTNNKEHLAAAIMRRFLDEQRIKYFCDFDKQNNELLTFNSEKYC